MSDKKNIDRLFQEKFKDFEVEPKEHIWVNIDAALREKKERRIVPFWLKLSGIAAGLVLSFFGLNLLLNDSTSIENNQVVIENDTQPKDKNSLTAPKNESVVATEKASEKNTVDNNSNVNPASINQKTNSNDDLANQNTAVVNQEKNSAAKKNTTTISSEENNAVAKTGIQVEKSATKKGTKTLNSFAIENKNNAVADDNQSVQKQKNQIGKNTNNNQKTASSQENNAVAAQNKKDVNTNQPLNSNQKTVLNDEDSKTQIANNQKSIEDKNTIGKEDFKTITNKKDSTAIAKVEEPNALEELLKKNEEEKKTIAETKINRWQISSNVAPIYFNSASNGSPIDNQFAENSKSYENNLSFGVGVNYALNKKLSVRTGVNKFTLGYNTNDVVFFAALDQVSFSNVASSNAGATIQVISMRNTAELGFDSEIQNNNQGVMTQKMGYFEVPMEMSYKLIDKKFGVNLIGGISTLFLNENEVSVSSSMMSASLGKANNLNDIHFSTNVGVGFRYRFWKSFEANFEPMFKYQINTFNKDAGNFKPYFIGLYSGVSFNF
ncbi:outer membrane beta-barrel protein [Flavobacterium soli]|uniref:outer membrane beta-barrel protein n=1 Tax=Flavobacterium soli TaxID=344881 RepID=UPI00042A85C9|nr:outer membrane beta-barrel protein [Flavobacterium soli]